MENKKRKGESLHMLSACIFAISLIGCIYFCLEEMAIIGFSIVAGAIVSGLVLDGLGTIIDLLDSINEKLPQNIQNRRL